MPARRLLAVAALGVAAVAAGVPLSGAVLDTGSVSSGSLGASPDWTPPTVVVTGSTGTVSGTTTVTATASDVTSSVRSVTIQVRAAGTTSWTTLCTATTSPYTCTWTTTAIPDGTYDVRAVAVDAYDNTATSATAQRVVDNTAPTVSIDEAAMPDYLRGTVTIPATATDAGSGIATVRIERSGNGTSWTALCTDATSPYSCGYTTSGGGDLYLRAVATDNVGQTTTSAVVIATIDNVAPTVTTTYPGSQLAGTVSLTATASDTDSGIASVLVEQRASSTSPWVAVCTATASPYTCRWDTTAVANGTTYAFRSTATDLAGNSSVSAVTSTSTVDNRVASVSLEDPGQYLRGSVTLLANANAPGGVASVAIQYAPTGTTGWATVCTTTTSPYTCTWDTTKIGNGTYDLRAVMTPVSGSALASATVSARVVDNSLLRGLDVQATNGGTAGRVDEGDTLQLTYSGPVSTSSLVTGWDGSARSVGIRLRDGSQAGGLGGEDVLDVFTSTGLTTAVRIGTVNTKGNYVKGQAMVWTGTMTAQTVTVNGTQVTRVTLQLGALTTNDTSRATKTSRTMTWTPSSGATSPSGQACSTAPVDETGALDRDF